VTEKSDQTWDISKLVQNDKGEKAHFKFMCRSDEGRAFGRARVDIGNVDPEYPVSGRQRNLTSMHANSHARSQIHM
jgi:hypothetical protein